MRKFKTILTLTTIAIFFYLIGSVVNFNFDFNSWNIASQMLFGSIDTFY